MVRLKDSGTRRHLTTSNVLGCSENFTAERHDKLHSLMLEGHYAALARQNV